jgi:hypothetical protein
MIHLSGNNPRSKTADLLALKHTGNKEQGIDKFGNFEVFYDFEKKIVIMRTKVRKEQKRQRKK